MKKLVITNRKALTRKYGAGGVTKIEARLTQLTDADSKRGIQTTVAFVDDKALGSYQVATPGNEKAVKNAVDHLYLQNGKPDYVLLLGAPDVVPHQTLGNPVNDDDADVPSDLPYSCEAPYSKDAAKFTVPSRPLGRIPDVENGGTAELDTFLGVLGTAIDWRPTPSKDFVRWFGLSAEVWAGSTLKSLANVFGSSAGMRTSPKDGPKWKAGDLSARAHFINCHGAPIAPAFYGQKGAHYPEALRSDLLAGVAPGVVIAAECCFGAQIYDPKSAPPGPTCVAYLGKGAYGFVGSTTTAYGPADDNGSADYVCQFFLEEVLAGGSLGSAMLFARQNFVRQEKTLDPVNLKTLAQFLLLGDPSIRAVGTSAAVKTKAFVKQVEKHKVRQVEARSAAKALSSAVAVAEPKGSRPTSDVKGRLEEMARNLGMAAPSITSHPVRQPASATVRARLFGKGKATSAFHVILVDEGVAQAPQKAAPRARGPIREGPMIQRKKVVIVKQVGPVLSIVQTLVSR